MYLAYQPINSCAKVALYLKQLLEEAEVHQLRLSLEILILIPLDNRVFELTNAVCVAEDFQDPILDISLLSVVIICKYSISCGLCQHWWEPLNRININHTLHIEEVDRNFNCVTLANLIDWLNVRTIDELLHLL